MRENDGHHFFGRRTLALWLHGMGTTIVVVVLRDQTLTQLTCGLPAFVN